MMTKLLEEIHPGEILKDEIESRNLVKTQFAKDLGILPGHLSELFKGKRHISASLALKLQDQYLVVLHLGF